MKKYIFTSIILSVLFISCSKRINEEASSCNFDIPVTNDTNPKTETYQKLLDDYCKLGLPGLSLVVETPAESLWAGSSGMARIEDKIPMQPCHVHHSASICKTYIATMIMMLQERGKLKIDDLAKNYLSEEMYSNIENADIVTIRQLLNHTSGIFNFNNNMKVYVDTFNDPMFNSSSEELLKRYVYGVPANFAPGTDSRYSNSNFTLLGIIIENVSGISLGEFMQQNIIDPFGFENTYYKAYKNFPEVPNIVNSYLEHFPEKLQNCTDMQKHFTDIAKGHEGVIATPHDFARFMKLLLTGNIISQESVNEMIDIKDLHEENFGLGIFKYETDYGTGYGHTGGGLGTMSFAVYFPDSETVFSICCNMGSVFESDNSERFNNELFDDLVKAIFTGK